MDKHRARSLGDCDHADSAGKSKMASVVSINLIIPFLPRHVGIGPDDIELCFESNTADIWRTSQCLMDAKHGLERP
jgi:hypothetical protein